MESKNHLNHDGNLDPSVQNQTSALSDSDMSTFHAEGLETDFSHLGISTSPTPLQAYIFSTPVGAPAVPDPVLEPVPERLVLSGQNHNNIRRSNPVGHLPNYSSLLVNQQAGTANWISTVPSSSFSGFIASNGDLDLHYTMTTINYPNYSSNVKGYSNQNQIWLPHLYSCQTSSANTSRKFLSLATDENRYGLLMMKIEERWNIDTIVTGLEGHMYELMVDQFGTRVAQKLFESIEDDNNMLRLLHSLFSDLENFHLVCIDHNGNEAVLKLMENLRNIDHMHLFARVVTRSINIFTSRFCGHNVIRRCFELFPKDCNEVLVHGIAKRCLYLAQNQVGCYILKPCIEYADELLKDYLTTQISENAITLSLNAYGNYAVQSVLELRIPNVTENIVARLIGRFDELCTDKYGSNVVERCFEQCGVGQMTEIVLEICRSPGNFKMILMDDYGNYVVQTALRVTKRMRGNLHKFLVREIRCFAESLKSHPRGKLVLDAAEKKKNRDPF